MSMDNISDTGNGHLQGVDPAQPRQAADWGTQQRPDQQVSQPQVRVVEHAPLEQPAGRWTDDDLAKARQQEKDKLYGRLEEFQTQLGEMQKERQAELEEKRRLAEEAAEAHRLKEESEMEVRDLLSRREQEMQEKLREMEQRIETDRAVFQRERELQQVEEYKRMRIEQEAYNLIPELRDMVTGNSVEEVDASLQALIERSNQIMHNFQAVEAPQAPYQPRGAAPTAPPVGPLEQMPSYEQLTPQDIASMDMETYKRYRATLLQAANPGRR